MQKRFIFGIILFIVCAVGLQRSMNSTSSSQPEMISAASASIQSEIKFDLRDYQWQHRIVLIFAPSDQSLSYQNQMQQWSGMTDAIRDRHLKIIEVFTTAQSRVDGQPIDRESSDQLQKQFGIDPNQFAIVLVGKDGTEKQRETTPTNPTVFFRTIDAMPMRQQEMRSEQ